LICNLQETNSFHPGQINYFSRHVSLDLATDDFCIWEKSCNRIHKLAKITADEIRLVDTDGSFMKMETTINRSTLVWKNHTHIKQFIDSSGETTGSCKLSPFTPFPSSARRVSN
jgi:hypothetical protein